ncbi:dirigent protein 21-like [Salvia splendens]|uniref:dirigent protein 21-like n=1 Tax=Salvia splendens TaxID=180675 RepID=UPI001C259CDA|nr:dirigent protein 21-like [Salvia splendens]
MFDCSQVQGRWAGEGEGKNYLRQEINLFYEPITSLTGPNATLFNVANSSLTNTSPTRFGRVNVFDDKVTVAPDLWSKEVARGQGTTTSMDLNVQAYSMNLNFFLTSGPYKGSTVTINGRNQFADARMELSVVGGAEAFRNARGYAITSSYSYEEVNNYSVLEYTVYVTPPRRCPYIERI